MAYTVKSSERLRPSAADTETKALLYLMNFRDDSDEIFFFVMLMNLGKWLRRC